MQAEVNSSSFLRKRRLCHFRRLLSSACVVSTQSPGQISSPSLITGARCRRTDYDLTATLINNKKHALVNVTWVPLAPSSTYISGVVRGLCGNVVQGLGERIPGAPTPTRFLKRATTRCTHSTRSHLRLAIFFQDYGLGSQVFKAGAVGPSTARKETRYRRQLEERTRCDGVFHINGGWDRVCST